jgi:hypothetical protein
VKWLNNSALLSSSSATWHNNKGRGGWWYAWRHTCGFLLAVIFGAGARSFLRALSLSLARSLARSLSLSLALSLVPSRSLALSRSFLSALSLSLSRSRSFLRSLSRSLPRSLLSVGRSYLRSPGFLGSLGSELGAVFLVNGWNLNDLVGADVSEQVKNDWA